MSKKACGCRSLLRCRRGEPGNPLGSLRNKECRGRNVCSQSLGARHRDAQRELSQGRMHLPGHSRHKPLTRRIRGHVSLLWASPACTHFSVARGGKPMEEQSRVTPFTVLDWLDKLTVDRVIIENVPEFQSWGPLNADNRPNSEHKGATFDAFIAMIRSLGYYVDWRVMNAADYGAPTTRKRLFIQAVRRMRKGALNFPSGPTGPIREPDPESAATRMQDSNLRCNEYGLQDRGSYEHSSPSRLGRLTGHAELWHMLAGSSTSGRSSSVQASHHASLLICTLTLGPSSAASTTWKTRNKPSRRPQDTPILSIPTV